MSNPLKHNLPVGAKCESKDENGNWWPIEILAVNEDNTYQAEVDDGSRTIWKEVKSENTRYTRRQRNALDDLEDDMYRAENRKDGEACDKIQEKIDSLQRGGIRPFRKGDHVEVKKHPDEKWKDGEVTALNPVTVECNNNITSYKSIRLSTKYLNHPLMVGDVCEGVDVSGNWWKISIQEVFSNGEYKAVVDDDEKTVWSAVHPAKTRAIGATDNGKSKKSKKDKKDKSRKDKKSRKKSSKKRKSTTPKKRHKHSTSSDSDSDSSKRGKHGKKKPDKDKSSPPTTSTAPNTTPQAGDIFQSNHKYLLMTAMKNGKATCVSQDGSTVAISEADLTAIGSSRLQIPKISIKKTRDSCISAGSGSRNSVVLSRDLTGPSKAVACVLSFDSFPDSTETVWRMELNQDCKPKKCDPPDEKGEPGPLSIGMVPSNIDWKTLECDDLPKIIKNGAHAFYYSSPLPDEASGTIGMYLRRSDKAPTPQVSPTQGTEKTAKEKDCHFTEIQAPTLSPGSTVTLAVNRSSRSLVWGVNGKIFKQEGLNPKQTYSLFIALSKGHSVTVHPPMVGYRYDPCTNTAEVSTMTTTSGVAQAKDCCCLQ